MDDYREKLDELKKKIRHHVSEEEGEMFPRFRQVLPPEQLAKLGSQMESRKEEVTAELIEV